MLRKTQFVLAFVLLALALPSAASAATVTPTRLDDPAPDASCPTDCSLREAIAFAQPGDTVQIPAGTYTLSLGTPLIINKVLTLDGAGARSTTIDANDTSGVLNNSAIADVSDLTIANGKVTTGGSGGGLLNTGTLGLERVTVTSNIVQQNGFVDGGGIANQGMLVVVNSSITHNFVNSLDNTSSRGGGLFNFSGGTAYVANTTFSDDFTLGTGPGGGGAIGATTGSAVYLFNVTLGANNSVTPSQQAGQILALSGSNIQMRNTVIALGGGSSGSESCVIAGSFTSFGGNVDQTNGQCGVATLTGDKISSDPQLGALGDNGGPTETQMPAATSPALDFGTSEGCALTSPDIAGGDQRGGKRTVGASCDSGSVERDSLAQLSITGTIGPAKYPTVPVSLTVTDAGPDAVTGLRILGPSGVTPGLVCTLGIREPGGGGSCSRKDVPWDGDSPISLTYTAAGDVNPVSGAQGSVTLSTLAPRLSTVSLRPSRVTPTKRGATLGVKKVTGAAVLKYTGADISGFKVPVQKCAKAKGKKCKRWKALATVRVKKAKKKGKLYFTARIKNKPMKKGKYRLALTATSSDGGIGAPWYLAFSVK